MGQQQNARLQPMLARIRAPTKKNIHFVQSGITVDSLADTTGILVIKTVTTISLQFMLRDFFVAGLYVTPLRRISLYLKCCAFHVPSNSPLIYFCVSTQRLGFFDANSNTSEPIMHVDFAFHGFSAWTNGAGKCDF